MLILRHHYDLVVVQRFIALHPDSKNDLIELPPFIMDVLGKSLEND